MSLFTYVSQGWSENSASLNVKDILPEIIAEDGPKSAHNFKMPSIRIKQLSDSRLTVYRNLRQTNLVRQSGHFIAEGWRVVERLLNSSFEVQSLLLSEKRAEVLADQIDIKADLFVLPQREASQLIGFPFHDGVLACAKRLENPSLGSIINQQAGKNPILICCPKITAPDNLGSLIRLGASFGVQGILLGPGSVDPYIRRTIRVSMGTFFNVPIRTDNNLLSELKELRQQNRCKIIAAEKTNNSQPLCDAIVSTTITNSVDQSSPTILLLGNEADGLDTEWLDLADKILHIPIQTNVDSLNVTHAAAIFLHELTRKY